MLGYFHMIIKGQKEILFLVFCRKDGGHSIAPTPQAPVRNRQTKKVANATVRIG